MTRVVHNSSSMQKILHSSLMYEVHPVDFKKLSVL